MTMIMRQIVLVVIGGLLASGSYALHAKLGQHRDSIPKIQRLMFLPEAEVLRVASLGYQDIVADFLWLQAIQAMGEKKVSEEAGRWVYRALDIVTTLDPKFVRVYEVGGLALCTLVVMPEESNALLEKGIKHNPQAWQLPFYLGINYYFEFDNDIKAGESVARAARLPGAPEYLSGLAARLYVSAKAPQNAVELLASLYEQAQDGEAKQVLEQRLKRAIVERDLQILQEAVSRYQVRLSNPPSRLEDLVEQGILTGLPGDPFGGSYLYDPTTQAVSSRTVKEKLTVKGHRRRG